MKYGLAAVAEALGGGVAESRLAGRARTCLGCLLLGGQVFGLAYARTVETRYFSWAPYDRISIYEVRAIHEGRVLANDEIRARYRLPNLGRDNRSIEHVKAVIDQVERGFPVSARADVTLIYRVNGGAETRWSPGRR